MRIGSASTLVLALTAGGCAPTAGAPRGPSSPSANRHAPEDSEPLEVKRTSKPVPYFAVDGRPFCFVGTNNYYLMYKPRPMVTDVLDAAVRMNLSEIRMWAFIDRGSLDGDPSAGRGPSTPDIHPPGHHDGVYFQYWDHERKEPAYNEGEDGLPHLDFVLSEARKRGLRLTLVLTNNWRDFGGMDQYLTWYGLDKHHEFYTDERVRAAYQNWIAQLVTRRNSLDGTLYAEDPAIFAWELANEPRTTNGESYDSSDGWGTDTVTAWADEMSTFIKSLDQNHMVAMGDEGFLRGGKNHWAYQAAFGIDSERLAALPHIDFGTYHLYPDHWGVSHRWGNQWIRDHIEASRRIHKPVILEEYGLRVRRKAGSSRPLANDWQRRELAYRNWNNLVLERGGQAAMFWILSGLEAEGRRYPDYDHFTVYDGDRTAQLLEDYADRMRTEAAACTLAEGANHGPESPFVRALPAPRRLSNLRDSARRWAAAR